MIALTIDGKIIHVEPKTPVLVAARKLGISVPTLCHHEALKPYGSCRLCAVEIVRNNRSRLVTSCNYPAEEGLEVLTASERVRTTRKMVMELLLARCPDAPEIVQLAKRMGITASRFKKKEDQRCILCGLCVRACDELVGVSAISFAGRGIERTVDVPFGLNSDVCIGCGTCTYVCPTGCIEMQGKPGPPGDRRMSMGDLALEWCANDYECDACDVDKNFLVEMKRVIEAVRSGDQAQVSQK